MQIVTNGMEFTVTLASGVTFNAKGAQSTAIDKASHKVFTKAAKIYVAFPYRVVEQNGGISSDCNRLRPWKDTHFIHGLLKSCRIPNIPRGCADRVCIPECNCPNSTWFDNDPNVWYCVQQGYCKDGPGIKSWPCKNNLVSVICKGDCPPTCQDPFSGGCNTKCVSVCQCPEPLVYDSATETCFPVDECPTESPTKGSSGAGVLPTTVTAFSSQSTTSHSSHPPSSLETTQPNTPTVASRSDSSNVSTSHTTDNVVSTASNRVSKTDTLPSTAENNMTSLTPSINTTLTTRKQNTSTPLSYNQRPSQEITITVSGKHTTEVPINVNQTSHPVLTTTTTTTTTTEQTNSLASSSSTQSTTETISASSLALSTATAKTSLVNSTSLATSTAASTTSLNPTTSETQASSLASSTFVSITRKHSVATTKLPISSKQSTFVQTSSLIPTTVGNKETISSATKPTNPKLTTTRNQSPPTSSTGKQQTTLSSNVRSSLPASKTENVYVTSSLQATINTSSSGISTTIVAIIATAAATAAVIATCVVFLGYFLFRRRNRRRR
ncbi:mucin-5AC-like [Corticium candelabrum]|uniref:mucin-5AC-like n=1 Tax=Corticium candelabrum TaxID=121492 RepID=UPI002E276670|nr:mucin-5AC-like [Corticium candelabrum]